MNRYVKKPTCIIHKYVVQNNCPIVQLGPPSPIVDNTPWSILILTFVPIPETHYWYRGHSVNNFESKEK